MTVTAAGRKPVVTDHDPILHGSEPRPDTESVVENEREIDTQPEPSPPIPISRRTLLLGTAAVAAAGIIGWRMVGGQFSGDSENSVERILDRDAVKRGMARAGLTSDALLMAKADKDELELWRIAFLPRPNGDVSQVFLSTTLDHGSLTLASALRTVELVARRGERAFDFKVLASRPYDQTRGVWVTNAGRQPYALQTGQNFVVNVY
jgi:hypothetical protein